MGVVANTEQIQHKINQAIIIKCNSMPELILFPIVLVSVSNPG